MAAGPGKVTATGIVGGQRVYNGSRPGPCEYCRVNRKLFTVRARRQRTLVLSSVPSQSCLASESRNFLPASGKHSSTLETGSGCAGDARCHLFLRSEEHTSELQ